MTLEEKGKLIIRDIKQEIGINPVKIFKNIAHKDYISVHGPEHHVLDGARLDHTLGNVSSLLYLDSLLSDKSRTVAPFG